MVSTDPIADMLTRIRNAAKVNKHEVRLPYSHIKQTVAEVLVSNNFIDSVEINGEGGFKTLKIVINKEGYNSKITEIQRLSKPGRRLYSPANKIPTVKRGRGIVVVSTSHGIMTGNEAKKAGLGGELICSVY